MLALGGERATGEGLDDGFFFQPTIFTGVRPGSRLATEEIFGPVLSVIRFSDLDEAIRINNEVKYGLSSSHLHRATSTPPSARCRSWTTASPT